MKFVLAAFEGMLLGVIRNLYRTMGRQEFEKFINNNWSLIEAAYHILYFGPEELGVNIDEDTVSKVRLAIKTGLSLAQMVSKHLAADEIEAKITGEWLYNRIKKVYEETGDRVFKEILEVIEKNPNGRKWLELQAEHLKGVLLGRYVYVPQLKKLVPITLLMRAKQRGRGAKEAVQKG